MRGDPRRLSIAIRRSRSGLPDRCPVITASWLVLVQQAGAGTIGLASRPADGCGWSSLASALSDAAPSDMVFVQAGTSRTLSAELVVNKNLVIVPSTPDCAAVDVVGSFEVHSSVPLPGGAGLLAEAGATVVIDAVAFRQNQANNVSMGFTETGHGAIVSIGVNTSVSVARSFLGDQVDSKYLAGAQQGGALHLWHVTAIDNVPVRWGSGSRGVVRRSVFYDPNVGLGGNLLDVSVGAVVSGLYNLGTEVSVFGGVNWEFEPLLWETERGKWRPGIDPITLEPSWAIDRMPDPNPNQFDRDLDGVPRVAVIDALPFDLGAFEYRGMGGGD